ncbi:MAG: phosphate regulon transcriptional regulator PhoB [Rhodospirillaceae bacterium]|jgi:two-component system phosphate regulon response regulator PhoB|nr:phosphate regulon transcriptional regulator PhoB [Rhodospirillaceae bacterium]MBT3885702.1 phosphate regulon transcriptional regulator PhoB [Rhodospirillaceae bacterium]MBT4117321.1 phosphate regulon transcriptional regulator PhoB [Rhodospirillaceae bacterium]MBT4673437.1 phosphate regulon transcriptional regulator PhoB [Rhodospirillaceae bacterium]MBT4719338.1 phosphate regulon transcriptional regulator PhoB [Rhodospirillaceae bacterium]
MSFLILIIEDEIPQAEMLRYNLESDGFRTILATTGEEAIGRIGVEVPDLIIVDWMLPERSGIDVCRQLRAKPETQGLPIIMLTARGEEGDRVLGLEAGADDYVIKPYSPREMVARVKALLRRASPNSANQLFEYAGIVLNKETHKVTRDGGVVSLGPTSFKILEALLEHPGRVYSRERLLSRVWGGEIFVEPRTVDVHIRRLRRALNTDGRKEVIRTVRGAGYALDEHQE